MGRAVSYDERRLAETLQRQHHVIGRDQALACGLTPEAVRHRIRPSGPWQPLLPGVYLALTGAVAIEHREMAALLHAGPRSALTGLAAARRHGLSVPGNSPIDVVVPVGVHRRSTEFVRIHRSARMPAQVWVDGEVPFVPPARAVADAARGLRPIRAARALVAQAIQEQRCSIEMLSSELEQGPVKGSAGLRTALEEVRDGIRSVPEGDLRTLLQRERVPMPVFNARLYRGNELIAVVDGWWEDAGVVAEVDSREYHYSAGDWQRTMRRHGELVAHGLLVLHFTPRQIRTAPGEVAGQIRAALAAGRGRAPLGIQARPSA